MKYKLINDIIEKDFARALLTGRGVKDFDTFVNPNASCLISPLKLDNIEKGANLLLDTLANPDHKITFIVDCDVDGFTSSAILWNYILDFAPNANLDFKVHSGKQHGLQDMIVELEEEHDSSLVILPDAGSNDFDFHLRLSDINIPVLVLDHHEVDYDSQDAVIINNQLSEGYSNKELTGAGVTWQFCRYLDTVMGLSLSGKYIDLAALGIISDMANVTVLENRYIIREGLENIENYFFQVLVAKQAFSLGSTVNSIGIAWYITPLINGLIRMGTQKEKINLFLAFVDGNRIVDSTKRGEKGMTERIAVQVARHCTNAKNKQDTTKKEIVGHLEAKIMKKGLLDNRVLLVRLEEDDDFPAVLNGLVSMQLAAKYKRPTIVARLNDAGFVRGSMRGLNESELKDFKSFLNESELFEYCQGHANAAGLSIKNTNIGKFHEYANEKLESYDFNEDTHEVNFILDAQSPLIPDLIEDLDTIKDTYGQMNNEPLIMINNINIYRKDKIKVIGKKFDTVKIIDGVVAYMFFKAEEFLKQIEEVEAPFKLNVIGKANLNEFANNITPQISVTSWEIIPISIYDF